MTGLQACDLGAQALAPCTPPRPPPGWPGRQVLSFAGQRSVQDAVPADTRAADSNLSKTLFRGAALVAVLQRRRGAPLPSPQQRAARAAGDMFLEREVQSSRYNLEAAGGCSPAAAPAVRAAPARSHPPGGAGAAHPGLRPPAPASARCSTCWTRAAPSPSPSAPTASPPCARCPAPSPVRPARAARAARSAACTAGEWVLWLCRAQPLSALPERPG